MPSKMVATALELGLDPEDLAETIIQIHLDRARRINEEGLPAQIEFLFSSHCADDARTMRALLEKIVKENQSD